MLEAFFSWYESLTDNNLIGSVALFVIGLMLLIKGGDWFVDAATGIAKRFRVPEIIIGATVVSIGTTLPEVMVSATAAVNGNGAIAYGNAIGSIICNTALIAALTIAIRPAPVNRKAIVMPVTFFFLSVAIYFVAAYLFGSFDRWLGIVMLLVFAVYMFLTIRQGFKNPVSAQEHDEAEAEAPQGSLIKDILGSFGLCNGKYLVNHGLDLSCGHQGPYLPDQAGKECSLYFRSTGTQGAADDADISDINRFQIDFRQRPGKSSDHDPTGTVFQIRKAGSHSRAPQTVQGYIYRMPGFQFFLQDCGKILC